MVPCGTDYCRIPFKMTLGLPASVTSLLTLVSRRMAKNNVYLKRLDVVEALGSVNIVASDKTGTLTKNLMTVTDLWYLDKRVAGSLFISRGRKLVIGLPEKLFDHKGPRAFDRVLERLLTTLAVCNVARFIENEERKEDGLNQEARRCSGSPSEVAMIQYCEKLFNIENLRQYHKV